MAVECAPVVGAEELWKELVGLGSCAVGRLLRTSLRDEALPQQVSIKLTGKE